ncbi:mucin-3A-like [Cololabis saira]|uniref:mucin-3A-like n=1 Tax=Cololabis saira TaxID=129043 RepID=UPI002AD1E770|nr:mucin-3A-like [Cololabis saira]
MEAYYRKLVEHFKDVVVTSVSCGDSEVKRLDHSEEEMRLSVEALASRLTQRAGGVRVSHDVILEIPNNNSDDLYKDRLEELTEAIKNCTKARTELTGCPYNVTKNVVEGTELTSEACVEKFYQLLKVPGKYVCSTVCDYPEIHPSPKMCLNNGRCQFLRGFGPMCKCHDEDSFWYSGDDCSLPIHKMGLYAGLSVTLGLLLVTVGSLTAYTLVNRREQSQKKDRKEKLVNQWFDEDFQWSRSDSPYAVYNENPTFRDDESAGNSTYRNGMVLSDVGFPQPTSYSHFQQPMRINRPRVRTTSDA